MNLAKDPLLKNYLEFIRLFRGEVRHEPGIAHAKSERESFNFAIVCDGAGLSAVLKESPPTLLLPDGIAPPQGWKSSGALTFMKAGPALARAESDVRATHGNDEKIIRDFSQAQCAGFLETPEAYSGWADWLTERNLRNKH
jgi:hypothetical protein